MNKHFAALICLTLAGLIGIARGGDKAAPKLDGTWTETSATVDGKKVPDDIISQRKIVFTFKDGKYTFSVEGKQFEAGKYKVDASKKPVPIDLLDEIDKKGTKLGVLKLDGGTLALSFNIFNPDKRPENLDGGTDIAVYFLKRK